MQAIRRSGTKPEIALRSALHRRGHRYRKDLLLRFPDGKARPDIAFTRLRLAVFLDGCYWHACPIHGRRPAVNDWYWGPKLARNAERDREADALLTRHGWRVTRIWEHEAMTDAVERIEAEMEEARHTPHGDTTV